MDGKEVQGEKRDGGKGDAILPNKAKDQSTFIPMNAGNLALKNAMILLNIPATAPGFETKSFKFGTLILNPALSATPAACVAYALLKPTREAPAARISGPRDPVNFDGSCSINF